MVPDASLVARFADDLDRLIAPGDRLGLAVSGGPDSLALLLLAAAARPGLVEALTVDHALRPESRAEAQMVGDLCTALWERHDTLVVDWETKPVTAIQEQAREARYRLIAGWLDERGLPAVCTGHHRDDQAETLLMRLSRGAGVGGLAGMRPSAPLPGAAELRLLRPLLGWQRSELVDICEAAGVTPAADPSNDDEQYERVRVRQALSAFDLDPESVARSAGHLGAADEAIEWAVDREWSDRVRRSVDVATYEAGSAPNEIRRRIVGRILAALASEGNDELRGRELDRLLETLESGGSATLRGVLAKGGEPWRFEPAPPRTSTCG
jgi:tRNA(Ile)-lysidine synthase